MAIADAIDSLITTLGAVTGVERVVRMTDVVATLPMVVVYQGAGEWSTIPGTGGQAARCMGNITIDFHAMAREQGGTRAYARIEPYAESIPKAILADLRLGDYVQHIGDGSVEILDDGLMQFDYSGALTLGRRWRIPFKYDVTL